MTGWLADLFVNRIYAEAACRLILLGAFLTRGLPPRAEWLSEMIVCNEFSDRVVCLWIGLREVRYFGEGSRIY